MTTMKPVQTDKNKTKAHVFKGRVVSDKMQKTLVVAVERLVRHPKYKKYYRVTTKFKVHDENNTFHIGDTVRFIETRPLSKDKRWRII